MLLLHLIFENISRRFIISVVNEKVIQGRTVPTETRRSLKTKKTACAGRSVWQVWWPCMEVNIFTLTAVIWLNYRQRATSDPLTLNPPPTPHIPHKPKDLYSQDFPVFSHFITSDLKQLEHLSGSNGCRGLGDEKGKWNVQHWYERNICLAVEQCAHLFPDLTSSMEFHAQHTAIANACQHVLRGCEASDRSCWCAWLMCLFCL